jgi:hypothetical protein
VCEHLSQVSFKGYFCYARVFDSLHLGFLLFPGYYRSAWMES